MIILLNQPSRKLRALVKTRATRCSVNEVNFGEIDAVSLGTTTNAGKLEHGVVSKSYRPYIMDLNRVDAREWR